MDTKRKIIYKSFRKIELAFFALAFFIPIILFSLPSVKGALDFNGGNTRIKAYYDGNLIDFKTDATTLEEALVSQGLRLYDQDKSSVDLGTILNGDLIEVNIEKSYQVVIKDGEKLTYGRALTKDERESLDQNKISHWPEDVISSELIIDPVRYQGAGRLIEIKRAPVYYIKVDRKSIEVRDWDGEVGKIIKKGKVSLNPNDIVSYDLSSNLTNGAEINITRINYAEVTETEAIDFKTITQNNYFVREGQSIVVQKGLKGAIEVKYRITYKDGEEVSRTKISSSGISEPRNEIIKKGLMPSNRLYFKRTYWDMMVAAGLKYGVSPVDLFAVAACESRVNPNSVSSFFPASNRRYWGMYQYQSSGTEYSGGLFSSNASRLGFDPNAWNNARAQINVTAFIVSNEGSWRRWGCKP